MNAEQRTGGGARRRASGLGSSRRPRGTGQVSNRNGGRLRARLPAASAACALRGSAPPSGPILRPVPCSPRRSPAARLRAYCWNAAKPTFDNQTFDFLTKDAPGCGCATHGARYGRTLRLVGLAGSRPRRPPRSCVRLVPHPRAPLFTVRLPRAENRPRAPTRAKRRTSGAL